VYPPHVTARALGHPRGPALISVPWKCRSPLFQRLPLLLVSMLSGGTTRAAAAVRSGARSMATGRSVYAQQPPCCALAAPTSTQGPGGTAGWPPRSAGRAPVRAHQHARLTLPVFARPAAIILVVMLLT